MEKWESESLDGLLNLMVGDEFGEKPEEKMDVIRSSKARSAEFICSTLGIGKDDIVLEIGSGMGLASKHVAKKAKHLHCCDISESFLNVARKECAGIENVSFHKISFPFYLDFPVNYFDIVYSDSVFIHLNLYDIFLYFSEFQRVVKDQGVVAFNIMNPSQIEMPKLIDMANSYKQDQNLISILLCWNSVEAIVSVARYFGFTVIEQQTTTAPLAILKFVKG